MMDAYAGQGNFEWDPDKARSNVGKHHVTFEEALSAFRDPLSLTVPAPSHSEAEDRLMWSAGITCDSSARGSQTRTRKKSMRKNPAMDSEQELAPEMAEPEMQANYSFKGGQRGRYAHLFPQKPHLVVLSPDMAAVFPDSDSVNEALRTLVKAVQGTAPTPRGREAA